MSEITAFIQGACECVCINHHKLHQCFHRLPDPQRTHVMWGVSKVIWTVRKAFSRILGIAALHSDFLLCTNIGLCNGRDASWRGPLGEQRFGTGPGSAGRLPRSPGTHTIPDGPAFPRQRYTHFFPCFVNIFPIHSSHIFFSVYYARLVLVCPKSQYIQKDCTVSGCFFPMLLWTLFFYIKKLFMLLWNSKMLPYCLNSYSEYLHYWSKV